jgi:hypothetical protein
MKTNAQNVNLSISWYIAKWSKCANNHEMIVDAAKLKEDRKFLQSTTLNRPTQSITGKNYYDYDN